MAKEKEVKKVVKKDTKKKNVKSKKTQEKFSVGFKKEIKAVKWPTIKEILKYTGATILLCLVLVAFFECLNIIMALIKGMFN